MYDFYSKGGDVGSARRVFDDLVVKSTATWTAIIAACVNVGKSEISLQLLRNMLETDVAPDNYVVSSILGACSSLSILKEERKFIVMCLDGSRDGCYGE